MSPSLDGSRETKNPITRATIQIISPDGVSHLYDVVSNQARLTLQPQDDSRLSSLNTADYVKLATNLQSDTALSVNFDANTHAFSIEVPADPVKYPSATNRVDEYLIDHDIWQVQQIYLCALSSPKYGLSRELSHSCDADSPHPFGIPRSDFKELAREQPLRARRLVVASSTMLTLKAGESRRMKLRMAYGYWGDPARFL